MQVGDDVAPPLGAPLFPLGMVALESAASTSLFLAGLHGGPAGALQTFDLMIVPYFISFL